MSQTPSSRSRPVALVTGGAVRVGRAIVLALAGAGFDLVLHHHRSVEAAVRTAAAVEALGARCLPWRADLARPAAARELLDGATGAFGGLDLLVNSAALIFDDEAGLNELARMKLVNIDAPTRLIELAAEPLAARRGAVVNIADVAAERPFPRHGAYSRTKAALVELTRREALRLAGRGVRVNAVLPGLVLLAEGGDDGLRRRLEAQIPLGPLGTPDDVAEAVLYLARARFVTGQLLAVDGGRLLAPDDGSGERRGR